VVASAAVSQRAEEAASSAGILILLIKIDGY
jgi:hypothetical protein